MVSNWRDCTRYIVSILQNNNNKQCRNRTTKSIMAQCSAKCRALMMLARCSGRLSQLRSSLLTRKKETPQRIRQFSCSAQEIRTEFHTEIYINTQLTQMRTDAIYLVTKGNAITGMVPCFHFPMVAKEREHIIYTQEIFIFQEWQHQAKPHRY